MVWKLNAEEKLFMYIPYELLVQLCKGDVVLFIGAGLSISVGLPGWAALIRPLAQSIGARWPTKKKLPCASAAFVV
jgi:hypothetical protein